MCSLQQWAPMSKYWATLSSRNGSKVSYFANVPWFVSRQNRVEATRAPSPIASPSLVAVEQALGWRVHIYSGHKFLHTHPDSVSAISREEALTKARSVTERHLLH